MGSHGSAISLSLSVNFCHISQIKSMNSRRNSNAAAPKTSAWMSIAITCILAIGCAYMFFKTEPQLAQNFGGQCVGGMCHTEIEMDAPSFEDTWGMPSAPAMEPEQSYEEVTPAPAMAPAMEPELRYEEVTPAPEMAPRDLWVDYRLSVDVLNT